MAKKLCIKTYGCQMNVYDSARMVDALAPLGFMTVDEPDDADLVILNTCHIREKAAEKVYSELGRLRRMRDRRGPGRPAMLIGVAGCVAQAEGEAMRERAPFVDLLFGPQTYHRLPELVTRAAAQPAGALGVIDTEFPTESKFDHLPSPGAQGVTAFLSVQEGCDKFCTFCVVPYTRGAEVSRPAGDIIAEAHALVAGGARELTLLGQNVNAYHGAAPAVSRGPAGPATAEWGLGRLIRALAEIDGLYRIRYTTSHPRDMDEALIAAHGDVPQLMPFLHLPVQSGSDRILRAMNRRHDADEYRRIVAALRDACPDLALSSDFIVGFPGETDADFDATMGLVDEIGFASAFSFKYSPRPGTPAAERPQLPEAVKSARLSALQSLLAQQQTAFNAARVGETLDILVERQGRHAGQVIGRSPFMQSVHVTAPDTAIGKVVAVRIAGSSQNSLGGTLAAQASDRQSPGRPRAESGGRATA